jgi:uncharacterized membrane protein YqiK
MTAPNTTLVWLAFVPLVTLILLWLLGVRYIPHNRVGVVEKLWSLRGSLEGGRLIALAGEAGFQAEILRGGLHVLYFPWQYRLHKVPLVVVSEGKIAYVYARDGRPLPPTQTLGRTVACNHFQDASGFLTSGGQRGRQRAFLREGVFALNLALFVVITEEGVLSGPVKEAAPRYADWHRQLQAISGFAPVVIGHGGRSHAAKEERVAYYGGRGQDLTGEAFRYGEQVEAGERGVWKRALPPGKYPLNPFAQRVELVPTVNFVLRWIIGQVEAHQYDKDLTSLDLITADGYEPVLPLSLVLHIDYEKAPSVIQRFGDVRRPISQTLDPILSAYFRDVAQSSSMLDLLTRREEIQKRATEELGRRFRDYDITCVAVLIGRPESKIEDPEQEDPIETLFDQLRMRRLAEEQKHTFAKQEEAAVQLKELNDAQAAAAKQTELTQTRVEVEIAGNRGAAQLAEAQRLAERDVARAEGESRAKELIGRGEGARVAQVGLAEAGVTLQKVRAYGEPRLFALSLVADHFAHSAQPIVPERLLVMGGGADGAAAAAGSSNVLNQLVALLLAERAGAGFATDEKALAELEKAVHAAALGDKATEDVKGT